MEKERYESEMSFLDVEIFEMNIAFDEDELTNDGFIFVQIKDETRAYFPIELCELLLSKKARESDSAKLPNGHSDLKKQAKIFVQFKTAITQIIERYKRFAESKPHIKKYDFDSFMKQVDVAIMESKLNVELSLLDIQTATNMSNIESNRISKTTNIYVAIFTFIAAEYYCYEFLRNYISDTVIYKSQIINLAIIALALLGIVGYRRIMQQPQRRRTGNRS